MGFFSKQKFSVIQKVYYLKVKEALQPRRKIYKKITKFYKFKEKFH